MNDGGRTRFHSWRISPLNEAFAALSICDQIPKRARQLAPKSNHQL
ncbi:hypothetical protein S2091_1892 [Solimicrobium silvestre]|uniref:Uncharacterized protein n=1 Tax=Solimicrobium silvestre TaxID=2099400 RepID=A0A2S9H0J4_9BURK|nr:hypothetical protein S2091_1892 [Solimicrobium silvestre]